VKAIAYLGLGSNCDNRLWYLLETLRILEEIPSIGILSVSSVYETEPYGLKNQRDFLNAVVKIETRFPPGKLLQCVKFVERRVGRVNRGRWAPREIDIDILLYGDLQLDTPWLRIPHPELHLRRFVLVPLAEIAGDTFVSRYGATVSDLLARCRDSGAVSLYLDAASVQARLSVTPAEVAL
jgi:2-amino-4-hydroxy-6-hydroxymethyldihydropteridine diphosphokinase